MKAQFVYENINFERNEDHKKTLRIGKYVEKEMEEVMKSLVSKHGGHYKVGSSFDGPAFSEGTYYNDLYKSKGRIVRYSYSNDQFTISMPGWDQKIDIPDLKISVASFCISSLLSFPANTIIK